MSKAIFFNIPAHGHVNPTLPLAGELVRRGHRVLYYNTDEFAAKIDTSGAAFRSYGFPITYDPVQIRENVFHLSVLLMDNTWKLIPRILDEVRGEKPDYIIHDAMCPGGNIIARILGVPSVTSISTFAFSPSSVSCSWDFTGRLVLQALKGLPLLAKSMHVAAAIKKAYGHSVLNVMNSTSGLNIVYTSRYFQPGSDSFDDRYSFVGPSISERPVPADFDQSLLQGEPVIYVSLGTVFNNRPDIYVECIRSLGGIGRRVVMSVGEEVRAEDLGEMPENFVVRSSVPQLKLLKNTAVFITHGGMNSTSEALYNDVPLVVMPQAAEQAFVADRVSRMGAGIYLKGEPVTGERIRRAVQAVMEGEGYKKSAKKIGVTLREGGGYARAADHVEKYLDALKFGRAEGAPARA